MDVKVFRPDKRAVGFWCLMVLVQLGMVVWSFIGLLGFWKGMGVIPLLIGLVIAWYVVPWVSAVVEITDEHICHKQFDELTVLIRVGQYSTREFFTLAEWGERKNGLMMLYGDEEAFIIPLNLFAPEDREVLIDLLLANSDTIWDTRA